MTARSLVMIIDSGEKTCANEKGEFCPYVQLHGLRNFYTCGLFHQQSLRDENGVIDGPAALQRLPECLKHETFSGG